MLHTRRFKSAILPSAPSGFSLIELLVTIGIIAVLAGVTGGIYSKTVRESARAQDLAAGKTLISAYQSYAAENGGELMVGYQKGSAAVQLPNGGNITGEAANRYAWRLAPYFDFQMNGIIYGKNRRTADQQSSQSGESGYGESLSLPFGMNAFYVGGYIEAGQSAIPLGDVATKLAQISKPSSLLVFATAKTDEGPGNFIVKAPRFVPRAPGSAALPSPDWPNGDSAAASGNVDFRYDNRALCAFMDGSIRGYTRSELIDMRLWSVNAAQEDNPNYAPTLASGGGGRK